MGSSPPPIPNHCTLEAVAASTLEYYADVRNIDDIPAGMSRQL